MDAETFKKVFLPYHRKLYGVACRIAQSAAAAEDIVQDTYIKLWNKRHEMGDIENTESFAVIILRNTCLDYLRKTKNDYPLFQCAEVPETVSLPAQIETDDDARYVKTLINELPEKQRQVIMLKHWEGYSDGEIEEITGLSRVNIRTILSRARKTIKERYSKAEKR